MKRNICDVPNIVSKNRYLGQGRPITLDIVAYHARKVQLMVQFSRGREASS